MKKAIMLLCLLTVSTVASAQSAPGGGPNNQSMRENIFNQFKQLRVSGIQERISILQNDLNCVQGAQEHEQMKACEENAHKAMESLKQSQQQKMQALKQTLQQERQQHQQQHQQGGHNWGQGAPQSGQGSMGQQNSGSQGAAPQGGGQ